jgi:hypothetical protein
VGIDRKVVVILFHFICLLVNSVVYLLDYFIAINHVVYLYVHYFN